MLDHRIVTAHVLLMFLFTLGVAIRRRAQPEREGRVARIKKEDQIKILACVNEERRPVRAVAAEFGCTPAAIYALLVRSRRESESGAATAEQPPLALDTEAGVASAAAVLAEADAGAVLPFVSAPEPTRIVPPALASGLLAPRPESRAVDDGAAKSPPRPLGARLAKPGMGLITRSADGDESMMPFRSLDDLLSAIKPVLREGARSPDPVWFSIQPIDLATIDADAA